MSAEASFTVQDIPQYLRPDTILATQTITRRLVGLTWTCYVYSVYDHRAAWPQVSSPRTRQRGGDLLQTQSTPEIGTRDFGFERQAARWRWWCEKTRYIPDMGCHGSEPTTSTYYRMYIGLPTVCPDQSNRRHPIFVDADQLSGHPWRDTVHTARIDACPCTEHGSIASASCRLPGLQVIIAGSPP